MSQNFNVEVSNYKVLHRLEDAWSKNDYIQILATMGLNEGLENLSEQDAREMCKMSLADLEPEKAAVVVLSYLFREDLASEEMTEGKIEQIAHKLPESNAWEDYADLTRHMDFFNTYSLLRDAFNGQFSEPSAVELTLKLQAQNNSDFDVFKTSPKAALVRLLSCGLGEDAILNRLYSEQISGESFSEAEGMIWRYKWLEQNDDSATVYVLSSKFWFGDIAEAFDAKTHADKALDSEE